MPEWVNTTSKTKCPSHPSRGYMKTACYNKVIILFLSFFFERCIRCNFEGTRWKMAERVAKEWRSASTSLAEVVGRNQPGTEIYPYFD